jgi:hypothetical protein
VRALEGRKGLMDERTITEAAQSALSDLEIDAQIVRVSRPLKGSRWCVEFTGGYGQFCDEFLDTFGTENSPAVVREKFKRHIFECQRKQVRRPPRRGAGGANMARKNEGALDTVRTVVGEVVSTASSTVSGVVGQASELADSARETAAGVVSNVSPTAGAVISPARKKSPSRKSSATKKATTSARKAVSRRSKAFSSAAKSTRKAAAKTSKTVKKAATRAAKVARKATKATAKGRKRATPKKSGQKKR